MGKVIAVILIGCFLLLEKIIIWRHGRRSGLLEAAKMVNAKTAETLAGLTKHRTFWEGQKLSDGEIKFLEGGTCPDCGHKGLLEGPHGGLSVNYYCGDQEKCGSRFNVMGPFGIERITDASPKKPIPIEQRTPYRN